MLILKASPSWLFVLGHNVLVLLEHLCISGMMLSQERKLPNHNQKKWTLLLVNIPALRSKPPCSFFRQFKMFQHCPLFLFPYFEQVALFWNHHFSICLSFSLFPNTKIHCQRVDCKTEVKIWQTELNSVMWVVCFVFPCRWTETWLQIKVYLEEKEEGKNTAGYVDGCKRSGPLRLSLPFSN